MKTFLISTICLSIFLSHALLASSDLPPLSFSLHNKAKEKIWVAVINPGFDMWNVLIGGKGNIGSPQQKNRSNATYFVDSNQITSPIVAVDKDKYYATSVTKNRPTIVRLFKDNAKKDLIATITFKDTVSDNKRTLHISYDPSASPKVRPQRGAWLGLKSTTVLGYDLSENVKDHEINVTQ